MNTFPSKKIVINNENITIYQYIISLINNKAIIKSLIYKDLKSRYSQTSFGWFWTIIQPLINITIYTFFFSKILKLDTGNIPYPMIALSGIILWNYISNVVNNGSSALINSQSLIKNVIFPKILLLLSKSITFLIDTFISIILLLTGMFLFKIPFSFKLLLIPIIIITIWMIGFTISVWIAAFSVRKRDILNFVPHIMTIGIWLTPVFYPSTILPEKYFFLYYLNPITSVIDWFRYVLFDTPTPSFYTFISVIIMICIFVNSIFYFKNIEKKIAEYL